MFCSLYFKRVFFLFVFEPRCVSNVMLLFRFRVVPLVFILYVPGTGPLWAYYSVFFMYLTLRRCLLFVVLLVLPLAAA